MRVEMTAKPKKIEPRHLLWLVLLLAAGSLPWLASIGHKGDSGIQKAPSSASS